MNNIKFNCPECENSVEVPQEYAGQQGLCPFCNKAINVPAAPKIALKIAPVAAPKPVTPKVTPAVAPKQVTPKVSPAVAPKPVTPKVTPAVSPKPVTPKVTPAVTPKPVTPKVTPVAKKITKKQIIIGGSVMLGILLLLTGYFVFDWYIKIYLPKKEQADLHESFTKADKLDPQKQLALLKDFADKTSNPDVKKKVNERIQETEEKIAKEAQRLAEQKKREAQQLAEQKKREAQQLAEARKREDIRKKQEAEQKILDEQRQEEARKCAEVKKRQAEEIKKNTESIQKDYELALTTDPNKSIFILRKDNTKIPVKFFLFKYSADFENGIRDLQKYKSSKIKYNETLKLWLESYLLQGLPYPLTELSSIKASADKAMKELPNLAKRLAKLGKNLFIEGNNHFHAANFAFCNVPNEKWLILCLSDVGAIAYINVQKLGDIPIFLELNEDGFCDVSQDHYNDDMREQAKKRQEANQKVITRIQESERLFKDEYKRRLAKEKKQLFEFQNLPDFEKEISGLVFFAKLRTNLNATGGTIINTNTAEKYISYKILKGVRAAYFSGNNRQGINYKWKAISGSRPRTVSLWFYCNGYNSSDIGNAIFSYGRKSFKEYFCIETNRSKTLVCPWGEPKALLAKRIVNYSWNHIAITYDGNTRTCYLNGKVDTADRVNMVTDSTPLMIGTRLRDENHAFIGGIRNVAIYNRALPPEEINILKNCGPALEM